MVSFAGVLAFLKLVDASAEINFFDILNTLIEEIILEVVLENVVQVITDNATAHVSAEGIIEERYSFIF